MIIYLKKKLNGLFPVDSVELSKLHGLGDDVLKCKVTKPRNSGHHRKYFAMLGMIMQNLPHELEPLFKNLQDLHYEMKLQTGYYEEHKTLGGKVTIKVKSINFESMDQIAFEEFYEKCLQVVSKYILPGITSEEIQQNLLNF